MVEAQALLVVGAWALVEPLVMLLVPVSESKDLEPFHIHPAADS